MRVYNSGFAFEKRGDGPPEPGFEEEDMYAVVRDRGRQFRVKKGDKLEIDAMKAEEGASLDFGEVLMIGGMEKGDVLGTPVVKGASVRIKVLGDIKGTKVRVFKFNRRDHQKRRHGHRQGYTQVQVEDIVPPK